jgi:hypothetical protein
MNEFSENPQYRVAQELHSNASSAIKSEAYTVIKERYGSGASDASTNVPTLPYHNLEHTLDVVRATALLAAEIGLSDVQKEVADLAASAHDVWHEPGEENELLSAGWLIDHMIEAGYRKRYMWMGALAILGTEPVVENGRLTGQLVERYDEFSGSLREVAQCVASADLAGLYAASGPLASHRLYQEMQGLYINEEPSLDGLVDFQAQQVILASTYRYPHIAAEHVFAGNRPGIVHYHEQVLGQLERGELTSWQELIAQDTELMNDTQSRIC